MGNSSGVLSYVAFCTYVGGNNNLWSHLWVFAKWDYADLHSFQQGGAVCWDPASPVPWRDSCELQPGWLREGGVVCLGGFSPLYSSKTAFLALFCVCGCFLSSLFSLSFKEDKRTPCMPLWNGMRRARELCGWCDNRGTCWPPLLGLGNNISRKSRK